MRTDRSSGLTCFRIGQVQIGARLRQMPRAIDAPFAGRVEQRRQPARRPVDGAGLGGDLALPVVDLRPGVHVGAGLDERPHHGGLALGGRPHQGRLAAPLLHRVRRWRRAASSACAASTRLVRATTINAVWPSPFGRLDVRAGVEQPLDHLSRLPVIAASDIGVAP